MRRDRRRRRGHRASTTTSSRSSPSPPTSPPCARRSRRPGIEIQTAEVTQRPKTRVAVDEDTAAKLLRLIDTLEDNDDVDDGPRELRRRRRGARARGRSVGRVPGERYDPAVMPSGAVRAAACARERQFRLLFAGQALSVVGDRMAQVVLAFAVLSIGGSAPTSGSCWPPAASLPVHRAGSAGSSADRIGRRKVLIASDVVRLAIQAVSAHPAGHGRGRGLAPRRAGGRSSARPTRSSRRRQRAHAADDREPHACSRPTRCAGCRSLAELAARRWPASSSPRWARAGRCGRRRRRSSSRVCLGCAAPARAAERGEPEPFTADLRGGWREVRTRSWVRSFLLAMAVYHVFVLPSIYVLGPGAHGGRAGRRDELGDHRWRLRPGLDRRRRLRAAPPAARAAPPRSR